MPADASIFQQYLKPPKSVMEYQAEADQADTRRNALQLAAMDLSEKTQANQRAVKVRNALEALGAGATDDARIAALKATATPEGFAQADALDKSIQERAKTKAVTGKDNAETDAKKLESSIKAHDFHLQQLGGVTDPESAKAWAVEGLKSGVFTPEQFARGFTNIPTDAAGFAKWKADAMQGGVSATEQLKLAQQKLIADNANATHVKTTAMTNATTQRGQDLTDRRARETAADGKTQIVQTDNGPVLVNKATGAGTAVLGPDGQPLPGVSKPLNESQSKSLLFGTRAQEAHKVLGQLASEGTNASVPGSRAPIIGGVISGLSSDNQQMLDQAKRDFMTAVLRRESGASISAGEFDTADKQYFPQIGDGPKVLAQKARNRELAIKGMLAEVPEKQRGSITPSAPSAAPSVPTDIAAILQKHGGK